MRLEIQIMIGVFAALTFISALLMMIARSTIVVLCVEAV